MNKTGIFIKTMAIISNTILAVLLLATAIFAYNYYNEVPVKDKVVTQVKTSEPLITKVEETFASMNTLIVSIGETRYVNSIREPKMWGLGFRELNMDLNYTYTLGVNMNSLEVLENDGVIIIDIPEDAVKLDGVKLDMKDSKINGEHSFAVEGFNPTEVRVHLANAEQTVKEKLMSDDVLFQQSEEHLKDDLRGLCEKIGVTQVKFR